MHPVSRPAAARAGTGLALVACALLAQLALWRAPWLDEAASLRIAYAAGWSERLGAFAANKLPPLYPMVAAALGGIGAPVPVLRLVSLAAVLVTVVSASRVAGRLAPGAGPGAAWLLATSPFVLRYSVELRPYAMLAAASALALDAAHTLATSGGGRRARLVLGAALAAAPAIHFVGLLLIPAAGVWFLAADRRDGGRPALPRAPFGAAILSSIVLLAVFRPLLAPLSVHWWMPALTAEVISRSLVELLGITGPGDVAGGVAFGGFAAAGVALAVLFAGAPARVWRAPLLAAFVCWGGAAVGSWLWEPVWWPRTLIPGVVPFAVATAVASRTQSTARRRAAGTALIVLASAAGFTTWVARDARRPVEAWPTLMADDNPATPTLGVPDYALWPLIELRTPRHAEGLIPLRLAESGPDLPGRLAPLVTALRGGIEARVVFRVDLTLRRAADLPARIASLLAPESGHGRLHVALVMSPDVSLVPALRDEARQIEAQLHRVLGPPRRRVETRAVTRLLY